MITIHNLRKEKPCHPYDIKVCRGKSIFGNPFILNDINNVKERDHVCDMYEEWFYDKVKTDHIFQHQINELVNIYKIYGKLRLFCWCVPKRCHAETIKAYIIKQINFIDK